MNNSQDYREPWELSDVKKASFIKSKFLKSIRSQKYWIPLLIIGAFGISIFAYGNRSRPEYKLDVRELAQVMTRGSEMDKKIFASYQGVLLVLKTDIATNCPLPRGREFIQLGIDKKTFRDVEHKGCWTLYDSKIVTHTELNEEGKAHTIKDALIPEFVVNPYYLNHELPY